MAVVITNKFMNLLKTTKNFLYILLATIILLSLLGFQSGTGYQLNTAISNPQLMQTAEATPTSEIDDEPIEEDENIQEIIFDEEQFIDDIIEFNDLTYTICTSIDTVVISNFNEFAESEEELVELCQDLINFNELNQEFSEGIDFSGLNLVTSPESMQTLIDLHVIYYELFSGISIIIEEILLSTETTDDLLNSLSDPDFLIELNSLLDETENVRELIQIQTETIQINLDAKLEEVIAENSQKSQEAILIGILSILILTFLAVLSFLKAGQLTQPVLILTNAIVAIRGNQYRSETIDDLLDRRDVIGKTARDIAEMAQELKEKDLRLDTEINLLKEQLVEIKRRKLRPSSSKKEEE